MLYQHLSEQGIAYGPAFLAVEQLGRSENEVLGQIRLPQALSENFQDYKLHPVLSDACLHILGCILPEGTWLPVILEEIQVYRSPGTCLWSYGKIRESENLGQSNTGKSKTLTIVFHIFDENGDTVARITGLSLRTADPSMLHQTRDLNGWFYQVAWQPDKSRPDSLPPESDSRVTDSAGTWLIFADRKEIGTHLAENLSGQGHNSIMVFPGTAYEKSEPGHYRINPSDPEDFRRLIHETDGDYRGIVHLWSLQDGSSQNDLEDAVILGCGSLLHLIQALVQSDHSTRVWLVTQGTQIPEALSSPQQVWQSPLWGLGKVVPLEHPELPCVCLDLDPSEESASSAKVLLGECLFPDQEDQIAYRQSIRYTARLRSFARREKKKETEAHRPVQVKTEEPGVLDNLRLVPAVRREPGPGEVEIQVRVAGLNFKDVVVALGMLKEHENDSDILFGNECAGVISEVGEDVSDFRTGDRVMALTNGSLASFVTAKTKLVASIPRSLSFEEAATIPSTFLTAYYGLHELADMRAGDRVLIHSAAGGVGQAAVNLARSTEATVFGTASHKKREFAKKTGVHHVMDSRTLTFADEVMAITKGEGVDIVLNSFNKEYIPKSFDTLRKGGCFVEMGKIDIWDKEKAKEQRPDVSYFPFDLGKIAKENPGLIAGMFARLIQDFEHNGLKPLSHKVFPLEDMVGAFRFMAQARHTGKVVIRFPETGTEAMETAGVRSLMISDSGSYLITGGLGGIGLRLAQWLAEKGARNLILAGRSRVSSDAAQEVISQLEQADVRVVVVRADVAEQDDVIRVLKTCPDPLRGIFHAAGVLDDGILQQQSLDRFMRVMRPKVMGAWNLHQLTKDLSLDIFVLFSSAASLLGTKGQGNYVAANTFMDALAHHRRASGRPALSVNWGPWTEAGMAAELDERSQRRLADLGIGSIPYVQGFQALEELAGQDVAQAAVLPMNWSKWLRQFPQVPLYYEHLMPDVPEVPAESSGISHHLQASSDEKRRELLSGHIRTQMTKTLGLSSSVQKDQNLFDLGLDSLTAIELKNAIQLSLGQSLRSNLLFEHSSIESLVDHLIQVMFPLDPKKPPESGNLSGNSPTVIQPKGEKVPFFCVSGVLGNVSDFSQLARHLGTERPFYAFTSNGIDGEGPEPHRVEDIAARHVRAMQSVQPRGPYLLGGHSFGARVAFEMVQQLQRHAVALLAVMDVQAFSEKDREISEWDDVRYIFELARLFERTTGKTSNISSEMLRSLTPNHQLKHLLEKLNRAGHGLTDDDVKRIFREFKAGMTAMSQYIPRNVESPVPIALFRTGEVHSMDYFLPDKEETQNDSTWGWSWADENQPYSDRFLL